MTQQRCFIGIGSNLNNPMQQVQTAFEDLKKIPATKLISVSSLYHTKPLGPIDQSDFVNAVAELMTELSPHQLLAELQNIEKQHGRIRDNTRWGPRTLDLDLLIYGNLQLDDGTLQIPHPGITTRIFVLEPLHEIAPTLQLPNGEKIAELLAHCQSVV